MKKPDKHTIATLTAALAQKGMSSIITVISIEDSKVIVNDNRYGNYTVDLKSFCESSAFPDHKNRRHDMKMEEARAKSVGKTIKGVLVKDLFYGPDRGYKNRSYYLIVSAKCGHDTITTMTALKKHRAADQVCKTCAGTTHGTRAKDEKGNRLPRTTTYIHWQRVRDALPLELQEYADFRRILGDKPYTRAEVVVEEGRAYWRPLIVTTDHELNLMATALRQAFRHSSKYKQCIEAAKVETAEGTRFRCAMCGGLAKRSHIQVDHIDPVQPIDGSPLKREELLDRVWTDKIQVLDKTCHSKKSTQENAERRKLKKERKK